MIDIGEFIEIAYKCGVETKDAIKNKKVWEVFTSSAPTADELYKVIKDNMPVNKSML